VIPLRGLAPFAAGCAALLLSTLLLTQVGFWSGTREVDTGIYRGYGSRVLDGQVPYRDFSLEYPPGALPAFVVPAVGHPGAGAYRSRFAWLMALCGVALLAAAAVGLRALGVPRRRQLVLLAAAGAAPLVLGPVSVTRYDLWPAALTAGALAAYLRGRSGLGGGLLGLATAAKLYPAAAAPVVLADVWRREGRAAALRSLAALVLVFAACVVPFAAVAPHGTLHAFSVQLRRPLELESLGAALLVAAHQVAGLSLGVEQSYGSVNLGGGSAAAVAALTTVLEAVLLAWIWIACARRRLAPVEVATGAAAAIAVVVAFGKVFSPQYLLWLLPLVLLVDRRLRGAALALLLAACALTQGWFPRRFPQLERLNAPESWLLVVRDVVVVALALLLARAVAARREPSQRAVELGGAVGHPGD
jgi:hypothetical protein